MAIEPADVFGALDQVHADLELIRVEMGRPSTERAELTVSGAAPREAYFEVLATFRKADRLCFEWTGQTAAAPQPPNVTEIQPADCKAVVELVLTRLAEVKKALGISQSTPAHKRVDGKQPSDVVASAARANDQLNLLVEHTFSPSDVYQLVTLATAYAARLHGKVKGRPVSLPAYEGKRRPGDVYERLRGCFTLLRDLAKGPGVTMLDLGQSPFSVETVRPSDCYDLAALVLSELVVLHAASPGLAPPSAADFYEAGRKLPSHVYQYAGLLEGYLRETLAATR